MLNIHLVTKYIFVADAFISKINTQTIIYNSIAALYVCFNQNQQHSLAGFEPGPSVPEADAICTYIMATCTYYLKIL
jgi:hypothetical protein